MKYVHYGHCKFIKGLFTPIQNRAFWMKPIGGLWGSMPDSEFSWKAWCLEENFHTENLNECFYFTLKPGSKVLRQHRTEKCSDKSQDVI